MGQHGLLALPAVSEDPNSGSHACVASVPTSQPCPYPKGGSVVTEQKPVAKGKISRKRQTRSSAIAMMLFA